MNVKFARYNNGMKYLPGTLALRKFYDGLPPVFREWALGDKRKPYLIRAPHYHNGSAGVRVLHLLCHYLNKRGERAYVIADRADALNPKLLTPWVKPTKAKRMARYGAIVVYPEIDLGNPFGAINVARYVLNRPGLLGGEEIYAQSEQVFVYSQVMVQFVRNPIRGLLFLPSMESDIFNLEPLVERDLITYYVGKKGKYRNGFVDRSAPSVVEITSSPHYPETRPELAALFRRSKVFYCFDMLSIIASEARLCGCPVVLIPDEHFSKEQIAEQELGFEGITYENTPAAIEAARRQVHITQKRYANVLACFEQQLSDFINITQRAALG